MMEQTRRQRVTAADVARSLGISRATVGFVLNETPGQTISHATRERVLEEARRLGYRPHLGARALASGQSKIILLVLPDWPVDYAMRAHIDEASSALDDAGYSLVTMRPHPNGQARPLWETLQPDLVMGLIRFSSQQLDSIRASGVPLLSPELSSSGLGADLEHASGPKVQVEHLAAQGHRSITFVNTTDPRLRSLATDREALARKTASTLGLVYSTVTVDESDAAALIVALIDGGVTAVAAYNDDIAALVLGNALRSGIDVPSQLSVIGHDDTPLARRMVPSLSSVHVDAAGLGRYFAQLALHAVEGQEIPLATPTTKATLVVRESTRFER